MPLTLLLNGMNKGDAMKEVWDKPRPKDIGKPQKLSEAEKTELS